ncbi:DUF732 domain-containing protein [Actinoplanes sp. NPDC023936]|uniref:DUF732 domain-containing protein n=1 Tax=Actinoplanes sp. NPDC023936 TaxID=3154910 RepID=UPI0033D5D46F
MNRIGLLLITATVPVIAGCGTAPPVPEWKNPPPDAAPPSSWPAPAGAVASPAADFVAAVRDRLPELAIDRRPEEITELGDRACAGLAAGTRRPAVVKSLSRYGVSGPDATTLVTLAGAHHCH